MILQDKSDKRIFQKGGFQFAVSRFLGDTLKQIEAMPENVFDEIVNKYIEMNIAQLLYSRQQAYGFHPQVYVKKIHSFFYVSKGRT
mgnify:CR=1 FL=1